MVKKNSMITGGSIVSMLLNEPVNDYDVYFTNRETVKAVAKYYVDRFNPKTKTGIPVPIFVEEDEFGRISVVVKSAGIASENGTDKLYQYFEGSPDNESAAYVSDVMNQDESLSYEDYMIEKAKDEIEKAFQFGYILLP